jgi:hypothetical protein
MKFTNNGYNSGKTGYIIPGKQSSLSSNHIAASVFIGPTANAGSGRRIFAFERAQKFKREVKMAIFMRNYGIESWKL